MIKYRLENIIILITAILYTIFFGNPKKTHFRPENILVVQLGKLGDMVCTTPVFRAVKEEYPNSTLYVLGNLTNKKLLEYNNDVNEYIVFENGIFNMIKRIKLLNIDFACIAGPNMIGLSMLVLSGIESISAPIVVGGKSIQTKTYSILNKFVIRKEHRMGQYAPREYLKLLEPIGIYTDNIQKHLGYSEIANEKIEKFLKQNNVDVNHDLIIGISPSSGNKIKNWGGKKFAELADYIYKNYKLKIIIIGGNNDEKEVGEMVMLLNKNTKVINTLNMFNLDELKAIISKMSIFISVDTGPVYIAEAFNIPTIDIIGPMDEKEQPPTGQLHKVVYDTTRKKPEIHIMNARMYNKKEAKRQIDMIIPSMVAEAFNEISGNLRNNL